MQLLLQVLSEEGITFLASTCEFSRAGWLGGSIYQGTALALVFEIILIERWLLVISFLLIAESSFYYFLASFFENASYLMIRREIVIYLAISICMFRPLDCRLVIIGVQKKRIYFLDNKTLVCIHLCSRELFKTLAELLLWSYIHVGCALSIYLGSNAQSKTICLMIIIRRRWGFWLRLLVGLLRKGMHRLPGFLYVGLSGSYENCILLWS